MSMDANDYDTDDEENGDDDFNEEIDDTGIIEDNRDDD